MLLNVQERLYEMRAETWYCINNTEDYYVW